MKTPNSMSSRDRMFAALTRQKPDHVPFSPYIAQAPWWEKPLMWRNQLERADRMLELGLDPTIDIWMPEAMPHPDVKIKTWRDTSGPDTLITKEYHTPAGVLRETVRETDDWCDARHGLWIDTTLGTHMRQQYGLDLFDDWAVSRRLEPWVKGREDLEKLRYIIRPLEGYVLDEWRMDAQRAIEFAKDRDLLVVFRRTIVGDAYQWFCDIPDFSVKMIEDPPFVSEFLGIFQKWAMSLTGLALELGVDMVQRRGWYEVPMFWGPRLWKQYIVPGIEEETRLVHDAGKLHCYLLPEGHGTYAPILKDMSVDALMGIDPRMLHAGDLKSLFATLGDKKSFMGGVNAEVTLETGDPAVIDAAVKDAIESLAGNGGLILGAFIFQQIRREWILHFIESWRRYRDL